MSFLTSLKRTAERTTDLLLPRSRTGKEPQSYMPDERERSRSPSPLLEPTVQLLTTTPPLIALGACEAPGSSVRRSIVAHAVLGSEIAGLHSLPHELLFMILTRLDAHSLCQLAQVSTSCHTIADDDLVWGVSPVGHCKEAERALQLHAMQLKAERLEAEARWRRLRWRQWKRRALSVLHAACGVALILLPLIAVMRRRGADGKQRALPPAPVAAPQLKLAGVEGVAAAVGDAVARTPQFESLVWTAATGTAARAA